MIYEKKIDELGRITLPVEARLKLNIEENDKILMLLTDGGVLLSKKQKTCTFCGSTEIEQEQHGKYICVKCIDDITMYDENNLLP